MIDIIIYIFSGGILGFLIGLTGVGGGVLAVPVLMLVMGLNPITAVGTASFYSVLTKALAGLKHYRQGTIRIRTGLSFLCGALPGVVVSSCLVKFGKAYLSPEGVLTLESMIGYLILAVIAFALISMMFDYRKMDGSFFKTRPGMVLRFFCAFLVGAIMGLTSVAGIITIPALLLLYRETEKYVGTSIFVSLAIMTVMAGIYAFMGVEGDHGGDVKFKIAGMMAVGSLAGTHYGSVLSKKIDSRILQFIVIGAIILAAIMMIVKKAMC